ncbi:MAG: two pore domain potassium channel family protein [Caldilineaceae bacterium]|nr:two pore domain potassium channel family protein [Caldilineaceae bacterium]
MFIPFVYLVLFVRELWELFKDPRHRSLLSWVVIILATGTIFYHRIEGWSLTNSFYFSVVTLATVGYGDLSPTTTAGKLFTTLYLFFGISIFLAFISMLSRDHNELAKMRRRRPGDTGDTHETGDTDDTGED